MESQGIVSCLMDFKFKSFVTTRIVPILYVLAILGAAVMAVLTIVGGFNVSAGAGVVALLIGAPIVFVLNVLAARIWLEMVIAIFRVAENTARMADRGEAKVEPPA